MSPQNGYSACLANPPKATNMAAGDPPGGYWTDGKIERLLGVPR